MYISLCKKYYIHSIHNLENIRKNKGKNNEIEWKKLRKEGTPIVTKTSTINILSQDLHSFLYIKKSHLSMSLIS